MQTNYYLSKFQTVNKLSKNISMFSREELFKEFKAHIMFGFLEGICLFSAVYESQLRRAENDDDDETGAGSGSGGGIPGAGYENAGPPRYADYREAVVAMIGDVIRLKFQGEAAKEQEHVKK